MPGSPGREQEAAHRGGLADAHGADPRPDVVHRVMDRHARRDDTARRVDVHEDVLLRILRLQVEELRRDQRGHVILDLAGDEHDPLAQQPRIDVEAALAAIRLLDHDRNESGGNILMIHVGDASCWSVVPVQHRPIPAKVQAPCGGRARREGAGRLATGANRAPKRCSATYLFSLPTISCGKWIEGDTMPRIAALLFTPVAALSLAGCGVNAIPTAEEEAKAAWANVQNQYQRRADLIPNLVESVKGAAAQERNTLREVTEARSRATQITLSPEQLRDPAAMRAFSEAQGRLSASLIPLRQLQEAYPDLKTNQNFLAFQSQLEGTENRITIARTDYNEAVRRFNTTIRTFPNVIGAKVIYGAEPMVPFEATTPGAKEAPKVDFGT
jgi:LemA protein